MTQVPKELIEEATRRGIVEGATILEPIDGRSSIVPPVSKWIYGTVGSVYANLDANFRIFNTHSGAWATVITPAPSKGLQEGDSTECGPAMRAAIIELAKELGVETSKSEDGLPVLLWYNAQFTSTRSGNWTIKEFFTPEEFIARMRVTASIPKPETIDGCTVEYHAGYIKVGCTKVTNDVVLTIYQKLKD